MIAGSDMPNSKIWSDSSGGGALNREIPKSIATTFRLKAYGVITITYVIKRNTDVILIT